MLKKILKAIFPYIFREKLRGVLFKIRYFFVGRTKTDYSKYPNGISLIGHVRGDFGLGESCRLVAGTIASSEIPFSIKNIFQNKNAAETNVSFADFESEELKYNVNLIHINPNELLSFILKADKKVFDNRYQIAYWLWELPEFPKEWIYQIEMFDEIWTPSEFVSEAVRKVTNKPVYTVPYAMSEPVTDGKYDRNYFGLPDDKFLYLMSYDGLSNSERKNPVGAILAYKEAFSKEYLNSLSEEHSQELKEAGLIIKATHAEDKELSHLRELMEGYKNVYILTDSYSKEEFNSLIKCADVYISLHHSEGFGLVMAEAMLLGTPTVATGWSANAEFMSEDACCMVPVKIVEIKKETPPYHKGNHWADPDVHAAAKYIRHLYEDKDFYQYKKEAAAKYIRDCMSQKKAVSVICERYLNIIGILDARSEN
ncbi:glycosyltransferase [Butyrivibrio sp. AC2005]|uniref:glycosyltransferase n=1 Tax=Butyrivibrio sp. AC2005 TaxID=1280672 RepID=UPI00040EB494|nr:glycosyltransferase [Butyrivibrio sp. AC2005]